MVFAVALAVLAFILLMIVLSSVKIIRPYQRGLVERLGRFIGQRHGFKRPLAHGRWLVRQQGYLRLRPLVGRVHHGAVHAVR